MDNYINGDRCTYENFEHDGKDIHAVARIRKGKEGLTLVVLDISEKGKDILIPSSEWLGVSRSIRRKLIERSQDLKESKSVRAIAKMLLERDIYFINDETDEGKTLGNPGVYTRG